MLVMNLEYSVAISDDGNTLIVGAPRNDGNGSDAGSARIFRTNSCSGCTDSLAINFNSNALLDDGSCIYISGCTDPLAFNYDVNANTDDGSCIPFVYGCTDPNAFNYDANANSDDGSCVPIINGCTDPLAFNYDDNANTDDGSCIAVSLGCIDSLANNYNPFANIDNETCLYSSFIFGCTDSSALNYNSLATFDDSSCCFNSDQIWAQIGQDIVAEETIGLGMSNPVVSISEDGNVLAIGNSFNHSGGWMSGHIRVYNNHSGVWTQIGQDIDGQNPYDEVGRSVSLSNDGSIVAFGSHIGNYVSVYENISGSWTQIGQDIVGINEGFGYYVSLNDNGNILAVGAAFNNDNGLNAGHVRVYENISGSWIQIGQTLMERLLMIRVDIQFH
jgi:hypothetical protein